MSECVCVCDRETLSNTPILAGSAPSILFTLRSKQIKKKNRRKCAIRAKERRSNCARIHTDARI